MLPHNGRVPHAVQNRRIRRFSTGATTLYQALTKIKIGGSPIFDDFFQPPIPAFSGNATAGFSFPIFTQPRSL